MNSRKAASGVLEAVSTQNRRRRTRVRLAAPMRVRSGAESTDSFEEICITVDISRDGILFSTSRRYQRGQRVAVTFPYSPSPTAVNSEQVAEVVRVVDMPGNMQAVAVSMLSSVPAAKWTQAHVQAATVQKKIAEAGATQPVVLVVGTDHGSSEKIRMTLEPKGYRVVRAVTASEALDKLREKCVSLVIAETEMSDFPGLELGRRIKAEEGLAHIPFVLLEPKDGASAGGRGALVCFVKPVEPERLLRLVHLLAPTADSSPSYANSVGPYIPGPL
jgi:CheY-like chemotaxis protein